MIRALGGRKGKFLGRTKSGREQGGETPRSRRLFKLRPGVWTPTEFKRKANGGRRTNTTSKTASVFRHHKKKWGGGPPSNRVAQGKSKKPKGNSKGLRRKTGGGPAKGVRGWRKHG